MDLSTRLLDDLPRDPVLDVLHLRSGDGVLVCLRQSRKLLGYKYQAGAWKRQWSETVFEQPNDYPLTRYPWRAAGLPTERQDALFLRHSDGIRMYQIDQTEPALKLVKSDVKFHESLGGDMLWGFFYPDTGYLGLMTRESNMKIAFYACMFDAQSKRLFSQLKINVPFASLADPEASLFVTRLRRNESELIGLRNRRGLELYGVDRDYSLRKVFASSQLGKAQQVGSTRDQLYFADLTHQANQDILHFNESGLFVYQLADGQTDYRFLGRHSEFAQQEGWLQHHADSVRLFDINGDSRDDLLFTGPTGLTAMSFELATNSWRALLQPESFSALRFTTAVGGFPAIPPELPKPSLFLQDAGGKVHWAELSEGAEVTKQALDDVQPIDAPVSTDPTSTMDPQTTGSMNFDSTNDLVPEQIARKPLAEPPVLRWSDQWTEDFFKEAVDTASGQVRLSLPLVDLLPSVGFDVQLSIQYDSESRVSDALGLGWSVALAQDYIAVADQGSIFAEDARYFLVAKGVPHPLEATNRQADREHFVLSSRHKSNMTIEFDRARQLWTVNGSGEQLVYGRAKEAGARDALQVSLGWPNWRGTGRNKNQMEPFTNAWYLNSRHDEQSKRSLYYEYDIHSSRLIDGKSYTSGVYLKSLSDGQQTHLTFDYQRKTDAEYDKSKPVDAKGDVAFPVALEKSHYLTQYTLRTPHFQQTLKFGYELAGERRLLAEVYQQVASERESLLRFSYTSSLDRQVLESCSSPGLATVNFDYDTVTPTVLSSVAHVYPMREIPKIAYGPDYAVMVYGESTLNARLVIRIMDRRMSKIVAECSVGGKLVCPPLGGKIEDYAVVPHQDSFILLVTTSEKRTILTYSVVDGTWSMETLDQHIGRPDLVQFDATTIVVAQQQQSTSRIHIFERSNNEPKWRETFSESVPKISRLALHNKLVVYYDDSRLLAFHRDANSQWRNTALGSYASDKNLALKNFDLTPETREEYLTFMNRQGLQVLNNLVLLSSFQENNGQLSSHATLLLLDNEYRVASSESFAVQRDNLFTLNYQHRILNSVYSIGYVRKAGLFRAVVKSAQDSTVEQIKRDEPNSNLQKDQIDKHLQELNEEFGENFKKNLFVNLNGCQIGPQGVHVGGDVLLRHTGTGWRQEAQPAAETQIKLGEHFILEPTNGDKTRYRLHRPGSSEERILELYEPGQMLNRYPEYIAYHPDANRVKVITFRDGKTLSGGQFYANERALGESDFHNLITVANNSGTGSHVEPVECRVRPVVTLLAPKEQSFVSQTRLKLDEAVRITSYGRSFRADSRSSTVSETMTIIPGGDKNVHGWRQLTRSYCRGNATTTQQWFNADGSEADGPLANDSSPEGASESGLPNPRVLLDNSGKRVVSDFSPYTLASEMVAYYGFEPNERNQIGTSGGAWQTGRAQIVADQFAFTGQHILRLSGVSREAVGSSSLEGSFQPTDQENIYLAACWIRTRRPTLALDTATSNLESVIYTADQERIIALQATVKRRAGDWWYLELLLNFESIRLIYRDYIEDQKTNKANPKSFPAPEEARFTIKLRVQALGGETVDVDHIRFSPLSHDFRATVFQHSTGNPTDVILSNGLAIRTKYDRLGREIANLDENAVPYRFSSTSKTGRLMFHSGENKSLGRPSQLSLEPDGGFYETFDTSSMRYRWQIEHAQAWKIAPGQLWHEQSGEHSLRARSGVFDESSVAVRLFFALQEPGSSITLNWQTLGSVSLARQSDYTSSLELPDNRSIAKLPPVGELIVMLDHDNLWLWLDGVLLVDQSMSTSSSWSSFQLKANGKVLIEDCFVLNRPQVQVEYRNGIGEKTQTIKLEGSRTALVTETLYDELGRGSITTKATRVERAAGQPLLAFRENFVTNRDPAQRDSPWSTGLLRGEVDRLNAKDQGFAYSRTKFAPNPLNQEVASGLPGADFSVSGKYPIRKSEHSGISFLDNLFPRHQGFRQKEECRPNGSCTVSVADKSNNQVAIYTRVANYDHLLSIYEYDQKNQLVKILPPLYHEKVETSSRTAAWRSGEAHLSAAESEWQAKLATRFEYDKRGNLVRKTTPDSGTIEYLYDEANQRRFMVSLGNSGAAQKIVFFDYDANGQLARTGHLTRLLATSDLLQHLKGAPLPAGSQMTYQKFYHGDEELDPTRRGRSKHYMTRDEAGLVIEKVHFNAEEQIAKRSVVSFDPEIDRLNSLNRQYVARRVHKITYPMAVKGRSLQLLHHYDRLGQLIGLSAPNQATFGATFSYHADGQLAEECYRLGGAHDFKRHYRYSSPGFLEQLVDPFLSEHIDYTRQGYGQDGFGDGMIMSTAFNASWASNSDARWFQIRDQDGSDDPESARCTRALKRRGYLDESGRPRKLYIPDAELEMPLVCGGKTRHLISEKVAQRQIPRYYGHRYAYGNHQELVMAKYFADDTVQMNPLQQDSFAERIPSVSVQQSRAIWRSLVDSGHIVTNKLRFDPATAYGKRSKKSLLTEETICADLQGLESRFTQYCSNIERLLTAAVGNRRQISQHEFVEAFLNWEDVSSTTSQPIVLMHRESAERIGRLLVAKGHLPVEPTRLLDGKLLAALRDHSAFIPEIVRTLTEHFVHELGAGPFDLESHDIDANGNHRLFYSGFDRYKLAYRNGTNQVEFVQRGWFGASKSDEPARLEMSHDEEGNVIRALHMNIQQIDYHPVSQRVTRIRMTDGRLVRFAYDAGGERILKRVFCAQGQMSHETRYLRDEKGRVLVDQRVDHLEGATRSTTTAYVYGPRGLLGFMRDDGFYSVTTDHAGSVRLVVKDGQVVAAYDYLPYGGLMRSFGDDPRAHIVYRFTGQEWDEETGLYNYHARLYDPTIGRFYQPDPKSQYFSPYKYAGNSPVSMADPDGEFAWLIAFAIVGALAGAYLGGAAANNRWNPADWDFKDHKTYLGIFGGALGGAMLPVGLGASVAAIGAAGTLAAGTGVAYLSAAAANRNFDPSKWDLKRPDTWNALFQGFSAGTSAVGGVKQVHQFAKKLKEAYGAAKGAIFLRTSYAAGLGLAYYGGVRANNGNAAFWQWNATDPAMWSGLVDGFDSGAGWALGLGELARGSSKLLKEFKPAKMFGKDVWTKKKLLAALENPTSPLWKAAGAAVMVYYMGSSSSGRLDKWNLNVFTTYEGVINGMFSGKDTSRLLKLARSDPSKLASPETSSFVGKLERRTGDWSKAAGGTLRNLIDGRLFRTYLNLVELVLAKSTTWQQDLRNLTPELKSQIDLFVDKGLEKFRNGLNKIPPELHQLVSRKAWRSLHSDSSKLLDWEADNVRDQRAKREVSLDEKEGAFVNCQRAARRKRSGAPCALGTSILAVDSNQSLVERRKELIDELFESSDIGIARGSADGGYKVIELKEGQYPQGFVEHLKVVLEKTPNILGPGKPTFFPYFFLGSMVMSSTAAPGAKFKIERVEYAHPRTGEISKVDVVKMLFVKDGKLSLRTFFSEPKTSDTDNVVRDQIELKSRLRQEEIEAAGPIEAIDERVIYIDRKGRLLAKQSDLVDFEKYESEKMGKLDELKVRVDEILKNPDVRRMRDSTIEQKNRSIEQKNRPTEQKSGPTGQEATSSLDIYTRDNVERKNWHENSDVGHKELQKLLTKLSSNKPEEVLAGAREFCESLTDSYRVNADRFGLELDSESGIHGFFYGALSLNFKYINNLDVYVERIAGRGYADLMFLSRNGPDGGRKNWKAIPIVVEFKADKTDAKQALDQIAGTGYLYNLSMRTVAKQAVVVGVNPKSPEQSNGVLSDLRPIPQSEGFSETLFKPEANVQLKDELKHLYYSMAPIASKTSVDNRYLSRFIMGELMSKREREIHVATLDRQTTFIIKEGEELTMLNILESTKKVKGTPVFRGEKIIHPALPEELSGHKGEVKCIDIRVNTGSKQGWDIAAPKRTKVGKGKEPDSGEPVDPNPRDRKKYYFQDMEFKTYNEELETAHQPSALRRPPFAKVSLKIDLEGIFKGETVNGVMEDFSEALTQVRGKINSEAEFQASVHGLFQGLDKRPRSSGTTIKVFPELNTSEGGRVDLLISSLKDTGTGMAENLIMMELKFASLNDLDRKFRKLPEDQIQGLLEKVVKRRLEGAGDQVKKYDLNVKSVTDAKEYTPITAVFCPSLINKPMRFVVHETKTIAHSSGLLGPTKLIDPIPEFSLDDPRLGDKRSRDSIEDMVDELQLGPPRRIPGLRRDTRSPRFEAEEFSTNLSGASTFHNKSIRQSPVHQTEGLMERGTPHDDRSVASSASRIEFFPAILAKKFGELASSILSGYQWPEDNHLEQPPPASGLLPLQQPESNFDRIHQQPQSSASSAGPSIVELGDALISNGNVTGLLGLCDLLARKWTGYRPRLENGIDLNRDLDKNAINVPSAIESIKFLNELAREV